MKWGNFGYVLPLHVKSKLLYHIDVDETGYYQLSAHIFDCSTVIDCLIKGDGM